MKPLSSLDAALNTAGGRNGRYAALAPEKLRGGYYTSAEVAAWLASWAIRERTDTVLEPSCGDGVFLEAAAVRLAKLGIPRPRIAEQLAGVEIIAGEAVRARARLRAKLGRLSRAVIEREDFFAFWERARGTLFDAVIGNPPFIRYQTFPEPHRSRAMRIMARLGLSPNRLTNIWVPFVAAAAASLRPGGRLALILPAELLQVSYASQLRSFLTDRFARIDIVACNELFFEGAEQEVVLLLADGALPGPSATNDCRVALTEARTVSDITAHAPQRLLAKASPKTIRHDEEKWLKYFLSRREISFMRELRESPATAMLKAHAGVDVGVVTGKNEFFVLDREQIRRLQLDPYTTPLVSRSIHLKGARIERSDWEQLARAGERVYLLNLERVDASNLPDCLSSYIRFGESKGIHQGYKCSIRAPWYAVPSVWTPDAFVFRQIYDFPRVLLNRSDATSTDTIHRLTCNAEPEPVISNIYTHLTAASAEIEGRSYGGGVLELEPTEAERLLVPRHLGPALPLAESDEMIRAGQLGRVLAENDRLVLRGSMGLSRAECGVLRGIWTKMRERRRSRTRKGRASNHVRMPAARSCSIFSPL